MTFASLFGMNPRKRLGVLAATATLLTTACAPDRWVDVSVASDAPPSVIITSDRIEIPAGLAAAMAAQGTEDGEPRHELLVEFEVVDPSVLGLERALNGGNWVVFGRKPGTTEVDVFIDGEPEGTINSVVTEQHVPAD